MKYQEKANQILKYSPLDVLKAGTRIAASGRSDFPNQINNAVVFPSVLRALLDTRAKGLDEDMLVAASCAIASLVERPHLNEEYIIPKVNDPRILPIVIRTLKDAIKSHINKSHINNYNNGYGFTEDLRKYCIQNGLQNVKPSTGSKLFNLEFNVYMYIYTT